MVRARTLPPEMQDELARILLLYAGGAESAIPLTPEAEADREEFASVEEVRASFAMSGA